MGPPARSSTSLCHRGTIRKGTDNSQAKKVRKSTLPYPSAACHSLSTSEPDKAKLDALELVAEQEHDCFYTLLGSIHIVAEENVVGAWRKASDLE